jgi:fatty-acyl-CoA synthase
MTLQGQWWSESDSYVSDIFSVLSLDADRPALHWRSQVISGGELIRSVLEIFHALRDSGARKGDVVAILVAPNSPEMLTVRYAAHLLGSAVCYLRSANPVSNSAVLPPEHQIQILRDTEAVTLYTDVESR